MGGDYSFWFASFCFDLLCFLQKSPFLLFSNNFAILIIFDSDLTCQHRFMAQELPSMIFAPSLRSTKSPHFRKIAHHAQN